MPTPYMTGEAKIFGLDGTITHAAAATTDFDPQSLTLTDNFDVAESRNKIGNVTTRSAHNRRQEITVQFMWRDAAVSPSPTQATTKGKVVMPTPLGTVTLSFGITILDGTWNFEPGASVEFSNTGHASGTFKLSRHGDSPASMAAVAAS